MELAEESEETTLGLLLSSRDFDVGFPGAFRILRRESTESSNDSDWVALVSSPLLATNEGHDGGGTIAWRDVSCFFMCKFFSLNR